MELLSEHGCHGGVQRFYQHQSSAIGLPMRFSVFLRRRRWVPTPRACRRCSTSRA